MSLSRDVLKWLQSLDLTFPVKNAKRDFSNGYTVAEILSCYFPQDIQMHSFDNATSVAKKNDNWEQLEKFFRKKNISIEHQTIVDTIHCKGNAAVALIDEIYTLLTNKKPIKRPVVAEDSAPLPTFARPTASQLIKDNISSADVYGKDASRVVANKAQTILEKQKEAQKQERLNDISKKKQDPRLHTPQSFPSPLDPLHPLHALPNSPRFAPLHPLSYPPSMNPLQNLLPQKDPLSFRSSRPTTPIERQKALKSAIAKKGPMPVTNSPDMDLPEIEFKQVQVKTIPNDISERLRARSTTPTSSPTRANLANGKHYPDFDAGKLTTMLPIVSEVVENKLANSDLLYSFDPKAELGLSFFESLSRLPSEVISAVFEDLQAQTTKLCRSFFDNPKEMLYFFTLVTPIFSVTNNQHCKDAVIRTLHAIGDKMTSYDASTTWLLFERNVFPFVVNFVARDPHLHRQLASVVYSFCPEDPDAHINAINKLKELSENTSTFIFCLLNLLQSENGGSIVAVYKDEALKALRSSDVSQVVYAVAVAILGEIVAFEHDIIAHEMEFLAEIGENSIWWEVKVQVVLVCCEMLRYSVRTDDELHAQQCDIIGRVLASGENVILRIMASMALAPHLQNNQSLYPLYVELLLSLSPSLLRVLLLEESSIPNLLKGHGDSVGNYRITFIPSAWNATEFLSFLVQELHATETKRFDEQHLLLCLAASKSIPQDIESTEPIELSTWTQIFSDIMEFLCLAFCNVQTCELAADALVSFMLSMKQHALQVFPTLHSTILMLFPNITTSFGTPTASKCQDTMIHFLLLLFQEASSPLPLSLSSTSSLPPPLPNSHTPSHPYFVAALENLVHNFPEYMVQTRMDVVIDKISVH